MTDTDNYLKFLLERGSVTLGEILKTHFAAEYRKHNTFLRHRGFQITCERNGMEPSKNRYTIKPPVKFEIEQTGQVRMAI